MEGGDSSVVRRLWSIHEIEQLAYKYAYAVDFRDVDMYRSLWAETDTPAGYPDMDVHTVETMIEQWPDRGPSILFVCNHLIELDDETHAHGSVYCIVQVGWGDRFIDQSIMYQDRYVSEDGTWRFLSRRHLLWFGTDRELNPFRQQAAHWPKSPAGRGTLPEDVESYRAFRSRPVRRS